MMLRMFCFGVAIMTSLLLSWNEYARADGPTESAERVMTPLLNAGIGLDSDSLIRALGNKDTFLATRAAYLLGSRHGSPDIVAALSVATGSRNEGLAFTAMQSLERLGTQSWREEAVERLPRIEDRAIKVQLASLLARTGYVDAWDVVAAAILDVNYTSLALEDVDAFENKLKKNGERIDLPAELERLSVTAHQAVREKISEKRREILNRGRRE